MLWLCTVQVMPRLDLATVATCKYLRQRRAPWIPFLQVAPDLVEEGMQ